MPSRPPQHRLASPRSKADRDREHDGRRTEGQAYRRWYWMPRWRAIAKAQIAAEPLCRMCQKQNRLRPAMVCDHIIPHRGDAERFWSGPFQSLCKPCHDSAKQRGERLGYANVRDA